MGQIEIKVENGKIVINPTGLSVNQINAIKRATGYQEIVDGEPNEKPAMVHAMEKLLNLLADWTKEQYIADNMAQIESDAEAISDIVPNETL